MYSIDDLFKRSTRNGARAGSGGAWHLQRDEPADPFVPVYRSLWHHNTRMLMWSYDHNDQPIVWGLDLGWGSVSDQGGMNRAFAALGLDLHYDRDRSGGGARIVRLPRATEVPIVTAFGWHDAIITNLKLERGLWQVWPAQAMGAA